ncbi:MAG: hypothetical protein AAFV28_12735 [Cyanobacteria bacterium J06635_13]
MSIPEDKDREFELREAELQAKERELRLRELETEIYQERKAYEPKTTSVEPPLYKTKILHPQAIIKRMIVRRIVSLND